jgi:hypothetical protein
MAAAAAVTLDRIRRETAHIDIQGTSPLIVHRWTEKAREMMLNAQQGKKTPKQHKDPQADFEASRYRFPDGRDGFPVTAFKKAAVTGGGRIFGKAVKMTELRQNLLFIADGTGTDGMQLVTITGTPPVIREDMVRVGMGTADIRHRAMYQEWAATLQVQFIPSLIDLGSVVALIDAGGTCGVGEWRPERGGSFGTFEVVGD